MIASLGVRTASIARAGRAMAVSELNVKYFAPLKVRVPIACGLYSYLFSNEITTLRCVACIDRDVLQRGAKFVVMVRVVGIKGVRMLMEHLITTLPERKVVRRRPACHR